jgi:DNA polymerase-3 subunit gamma/tau
MAEALPMRALTRMWQMLLKALEEVAVAPNAMMAAEMAVIRLTHVADLPSPEDLVRRLNDATPPPTGPAPAPRSQNAPAPGRAPVQQAPHQASSSPGGGATALAVQPVEALARNATFGQVMDLIAANRDMTLKIEVEDHLRLARYTPGRIEFTPTDAAPRDLAARLGQRLQAWTGVRWGVSVVPGCTEPTLSEIRDADRLADEARARECPLVQAVLTAFPGARVEVKPPPEAEALTQALPEVDEEWDPFEEE